MPKKHKTQKILIPKGMIDPNEDTLIEIPTEFKQAPMVVATRQGIQETSVSLESSARERDGSKVILTEGKSTVKIIENDEAKSFSKRQENISSMPPMCCIKGNPELLRKYEEMEKARKELEESAFLTATNSQASTSICSGIKDESFAPKRSCLSAKASCDKSLQFKASKSVSVGSAKKPHQRSSSGGSKEEIITTNQKSDQNTSVYPDNPPKPTSRRAKKMTNQTSSMSDFGIPTSRDLKDKKVDNDGFSVIHKPCSTCTDDPLIETVEKSDVPLMEEKQTSAVCLNHSCLEAGKQERMRDQSVQPKCSTMGDKSIPSTTSSKISKNSTMKSTCKECDESDAESSGEDLSSERKKKLQEFYKCSRVDIDYVYISQLKRQFDEAKRKLEDAVMLASISLKQLAGKHYGGDSMGSCYSRKTTSSICDSVPERDICMPTPKRPEKKKEVARFDSLEIQDTKLTAATGKIPVNTNSFRSSYSKSPVFDTDSTSPFLKEPKRISPPPTHVSRDMGVQTVNSPTSIKISMTSVEKKDSSMRSLELVEITKKPSSTFDSGPRIAVESSKSVEKKPSGSKSKCLSKTCSKEQVVVAPKANCGCGSKSAVQQKEKEKSRSEFFSSSRILK